MASKLLSAVLLLSVVLFTGLGFVARGLLHLGLSEMQSVVLLVVVGVVTYAVAAALAIREAIILARRRDLAALRRSTMLVKVAGIPFFVLNFALLGGVIFVGWAFAGFPILLAPFAVAGTYLVMLPTSAYGVACLVLMRRDRAISTRFFTVNLVLHLMFVTDIVSTFVVANRARAVLAQQHVTPVAPPL